MIAQKKSYLYSVYVRSLVFNLNINCNEFLETLVLGIGVRLVDGLKPYEGRVEVSHEGQWGTICNNGFSVNDATVICRMLGFETE